MFMGKYNHTIDPKGRLSIPAKYREKLGDEFVVASGIDGCLFVYANDDWEALFEQIKTYPTLTDEEIRELKRYLYTGAQPVTVDKQGRILLTQDMREAAGLEKDVVLAGVGDYIEIWDEERWKAKRATMDIQKITRNLSAAGIRI